MVTPLPLNKTLFPPNSITPLIILVTTSDIHNVTIFRPTTTTPKTIKNKRMKTTEQQSNPSQLPPTERQERFHRRQYQRRLIPSIQLHYSSSLRPSSQTIEQTNQISTDTFTVTVEFNHITYQLEYQIPPPSQIQLSPITAPGYPSLHYLNQFFTKLNGYESNSVVTDGSNAHRGSILMEPQYPAFVQLSPYLVVADPFNILNNPTDTQQQTETSPT